MQKILYNFQILIVHIKMYIQGSFIHEANFPDGIWFSFPILGCQRALGPFFLV